MKKRQGHDAFEKKPVKNQVSSKFVLRLHFAIGYW